MGAQMITVFIVLLVTCGFALVALYFTAIEINGRIKQKVVDELQAYDTLIQQKEDELTALRAKLSEEVPVVNEAIRVAAPGTGVVGAYQTPAAEFVSKQFFSDYGSIRSHFTADRMTIENSLRQFEPLREEKRSAVIKGIIEKLHFENAFKISVLHSDEQLEVLDGILSDAEKAVLADYRQTVDRFDCAAFFSWLHVNEKSLDRTVRVLSAEETTGDLCESVFAEAASSSSGGSALSWQKDNELCEGFQVRVGNQLFDYGIRKSELMH